MKLVHEDVRPVTADSPALYVDRAAALGEKPPAGLPTLLNVGGVAVPGAPATVEGTGVETSILSDLALKLANSVPRLTSEWAAEQLRLPIGVVEKLFWQLREDQYLEILGQSGAMTYRYAITQRGREFAKRLLEISGYVGPAPVSLEAYTAMLRWQIERQLPVSAADVEAALASMVLPKGTVEVAALAAASGRSLFLFGPPGNGKTSLAMLLRQVLVGELWIPRCICVESNIIRLYDPQCHEIVPLAAKAQASVDHRWVRVRRPAVVAGGEMTIGELDLTYSPSQRFYEAPAHVKANGGMFFLDDLGRQRVNPAELLNRWIVPLEQQIDYLALANGQKICLPFRLMLIAATNLSAAADPAFLRRMGYRIHMENPDEVRYAEIIRRYARKVGADVDEAAIAGLLERYGKEHRDLRACEPRDLIERCRDIANLRGERVAITKESLDLAWWAYFGESVSEIG